MPPTRSVGDVTHGHPSEFRVAFFGSPDFAVPALERLHQRHRLVLVVTQPDAPAGRGMRLRPPAVAKRAEELGLPLAQPTRIRSDQAFAARLAELRPDVAVTVAYGQILPGSLLKVPTHGFLNAHASLLPELRGAAPIAWSLIRGDEETGISVMETEAGLDSGPVRHVVRTSVAPDETATELTERLSRLAADALSQALEALAEGRLVRTLQDDSKATLAPRLRKEDGQVRWSDTARQVYDRWRGVLPWPGSRFQHDGRWIRIDRLERLGDPASRGAAGEVLATDPAGVVVACGAGAVRLLEVTPAGKRSMPAADWARGARVGEGDRLA